MQKNNDDFPGTQTSSSDENWNLEALKLDQDFDTKLGIQQVHAAVTVRKPGNQEWFRVHPSKEMRLQTTILRLKEKGEDYLVAPNLREALWDEIQPVMLFTAVNRDGEVFIWPVRLPRGDGRTDQFMVSDMEAAKAAESNWTRRQWVPENKSHKITIANGLTDEPMWPEITILELTKTGFKEKYICDLDHPVLKRLRGEVRGDEVDHEHPAQR